jgi:hypothetical protein
MGALEILWGLELYWFTFKANGELFAIMDLLIKLLMWLVKVSAGLGQKRLVFYIEKLLRGH